MALLKEHFLFGVQVGGTLHLVLFLIAAYLGLFSGPKWLVFSFFGGPVAVVIGSILPDIDAPRSPVHDAMLVSFGSVVTIFVEKLSMSYIPLLLVPIFSIWIDRKHLRTNPIPQKRSNKRLQQNLPRWPNHKKRLMRQRS